ncbi:MAG: sporulation protein YqfD [Clostridia bacterium]|nr:sporulation protein YqfD [Clostridia bacterium]
MIILGIINFLKGYVKIHISGRYTERFINICAKRNIYIWNIKRKSANLLEACVSMQAFEMTGDIAADAETEILEVGRGGFPVLFEKIMSRSGLIVGFCVVTALFFWMTGRVWHIEIAPTAIPENEIREQLKKSGLDIGVKLSEVDTRKIQAKMMNLNPGIEWIWTEKSGTKIFVDLRERVKKPDTVNINEPCNLVATHAGKVTFAMIKEGRAMVSAGMRVSEGQLLAGGVLGSSVVGAREVHSQGSVKADVFIEKSGDYLLETEKSLPTGNEEKSYRLWVGQREIKLLSPKSKFEEKTETSEKFPLRIGDIYFPVGVIKTVTQEKITKKVKLNKENVVKDAEKYLDELLQKEVGSGTIIERYFFVEDIDEKTVRVRMQALCNMEIAKKQPIGEEMYGR